MNPRSAQMRRRSCFSPAFAAPPTPRTAPPAPALRGCVACHQDDRGARSMPRSPHARTKVSTTTAAVTSSHAGSASRSAAATWCALGPIVTSGRTSARLSRRPNATSRRRTGASAGGAAPAAAPACPPARAASRAGYELAQVVRRRSDDDQRTARREHAGDLLPVAGREHVEREVGSGVAQRQRPPQVGRHAGDPRVRPDRPAQSGAAGVERDPRPAVERVQHPREVVARARAEVDHPAGPGARRLKRDSPSLSAATASAIGA